MKEFSACVRNQVLQPVERLVREQPQWPEAYRTFWPASGEAFLWTRCAVVAGAVTGSSPEQEQGIRDVQRRLREFERLISCWSPSVSERSRPGLVEQTLKALGFPSREAFLEQVRTLGKMS